MYLTAILLLLINESCNKTTFKERDAIDAGQTADAALVPKLNIIIILADDLGYEVPNYTGGQSYETPNINMLAAGGTQFTHCHSSPLCSPSRFMMLTGKYNFRNYYEWGTMNLDQRTIANVAKKAGYTTCVAGKWQLDHGDTAVKTFGFDKYCIDIPFNNVEERIKVYKNPEIYENGNFLPDSLTANKYGQNIFRDYIFDFIDKNKTKPFFIYWTPNLPHRPWGPTPDDPEYATWSRNSDTFADTIFFPSMVKYLDKMVGQLILKLRSSNLEQKTVVFFVGDNGTETHLYSTFNGEVVRGGKALTYEAGTHVPLVAYCPGKVPAGDINNTLIDFTDFMPTIADIVQTSVPLSYGVMDGVSFAPKQIRQDNKVKESIFCHYYPHPEGVKNNYDSLARWMQNATYKRYDTSSHTRRAGNFYNFVTDPLELTPILPAQMTLEQKQLNQNFLQKMSTLN